MSDSDRHNLLIVSDLHFGESLVRSDPGFLKAVARLKLGFCRFLKHYAEHRNNGQPWRLVVAGDMLEFLRTSLEAEQGSKAAAQPDDWRVDGDAEASAVAALDRIIDHERRVFRFLAAFVGQGNDLVVIKGNHDAELHWEAVQARFRTRLTEIYAQTGGEALEAFGDRISFYRWFYFEPDLVYIEHGNQYDEHCAFEHVLSPVLPDSGELEDPLSHQLARAFAGQTAGIDLHAVDRWSFTDFIRWLLGAGPRLFARLAYSYFASVAWMIRTRRRLYARARAARIVHQGRMRQLKRRFGIAEEKLLALDNLRKRPSWAPDGVLVLYMDRVVLGILNALLLPILVLAPGDWTIRLGLGAALAITSLVLVTIFSRFRETESHEKLRQIAGQVAKMMRVPYVVFGHSHVPVAEEVAEKGTYFNTGSWTEGERGMTYVAIETGGKTPIGRLLRWDTKARRPLRIEPETSSAS